MTYTPDEGMTKKQIEKEVQRQAVLFEEKCKHGSVAHDNRMNIKNVATRPGHSQLKTTNRYVHATDQAERESANLLENILNKKAQHTA